MCNPVDVNDSTGPWSCDTEIGNSGSASNPTCEAHNFHLFNHSCMQGYGKTVRPLPPLRFSYSLVPHIAVAAGDGNWDPV